MRKIHKAEMDMPKGMNNLFSAKWNIEQIRYNVLELDPTLKSEVY